MRISLVSCIAGLVAVAEAASTLDQAVSQLPACTISCSKNKLAVPNCPVTDIQTCFCRNSTLQSELFICVMNACNYTDQIVSAEVSQNLICNGIPQPSRRTEVIRFIAIISAVTFPFILLRGISRYLTSTFWWDDWIVLVSGVLLIPMTAIPIYNATKGFGDHLWNVPPQNIIVLQKLYYVSNILYSMVISLVKMSILFFYLRIFPGERFRLITKCLIGAVSLTGMSFCLAVTFQCIPIHAAWDLSIDAKCISSTGLIYAGAAISILQDIVVILLPIPALKALQLSLRKRIALMFMFALGSFACLTSIYRVKWLVFYQFHSLDATWVNVDPVIWSVFEAYSAMICTSLMTVRPLLVRYMPQIFNNPHSRNWNNVSSSHRRSRIGLHRISKPRSGANGIELPSQENIFEHRTGSLQDGGKGRIEVWVENIVPFEENAPVVRS